MPTLRLALLAAVAAALLTPAAASARDFFLTARDDIATVLSGATGLRDGDRIYLSDDDGTFAHVDTTASFRTDVVVQPRAGEAPTTEGWWFQSGASHIVLRGFTIREPNYTATNGGSAVQVDAGASDVAIEDCKLLEGRHGLRITGSDESSPSNVTLRDSEISGDGTSDGIQIDAVNIGAGHDIAIDHNRIHDIHIGLSDGAGGVQHDDGVQVFIGDDVQITRNTIWLTTPQAAGPNQGIIVGRVADNYGVSGKNVEHVTIEDNLIYQWPGSGITVSGADDVDVIHNTSYDSGERGADNALSISEPTLRDGRTLSLNSGLTIANDVIDKLAIVSGAANPATCTTNLISTFNPRGASSACTSTDTSDPLFEGSAYYLQSGSPAIGAANGSYPLLAGLGDRDETTRDAAPDLGAREWHPLTDTLTDTGVVLSRHTGEGSLGWSLVTADPGTASISANALLADAEDTIYSYAASWTPSDNTYAVETVVVYRGPGSGDFSGPVCRWSAAGSKNGYMGRIKDGQVELIKFVSGSSTILATAALPSTYYSGQPLKVGLDCDATKTVAIDGAAVVSSRDDVVTQTGKAGVRGNTQTLPIDTVAAYDS